MDHGRIVEHGRHEQLGETSGLYARLWAERERAATWRISQPQPAS